MAVFTRLSAQSRLPLLHFKNSVTFIRPVTMKVTQPGQSVSNIENYEEYNEKLGRPLSPHLSVYAPQLTSMLSITHRMTGVYMAGCAVTLGLGTLILPEPITHYIEAVEALKLGAPIILGSKLILAFPFAYHVSNGVRHLVWDSGKFLTNSGVNTTGYIMLASAFLITAGLLAL